MTYNMHKEMSNLFGDWICKNHFEKYLNKKAFFSFTRLIEDIIRPLTNNTIALNKFDLLLGDFVEGKIEY